MTRISIGRSHLATVLAAALSTALAAQTSEPARKSKLTGAYVPPAAQRLLAKQPFADAEALLLKLRPDVRCTEVEVLLWSGDCSGEAGAAMRLRAGRSIARAGGEYREGPGPTQQDGRLVYLCDGQVDRQRFAGAWVASQDGQMLVWGRPGAAVPAGVGATFGNVDYIAPKGWQVTVASDSVTLTPNDLLPQEKLFMMLLQGREFRGELAVAGDLLWGETCKLFEVEGKLWPSDKGAVVASRPGFEHCVYGCWVRKGEATLFLQVFFLHVGDRLERVAVITNQVNRPYDETPAYSPKYSRAIADFVYTLRFHNLPVAAPAAPSLHGDGIVGVWIGLGMGSNGLRGTIELKAFKAVFFANGMAVYADNLPSLGFAGNDLAVEREVSPWRWGSYTFADGEGALQVGSKRIALRQQGDKLVLDANKTEHVFVKLPTVDGARFDGAYAFAERDGRTPTLSFTTDGHFEDDGAVKVLEHGLYALYSIGDTPGGGHYEVRDFTLLLHYDDGREFGVPFTDLQYHPGDPHPATLTLSFNDDVLQRR